MKAIEKPGALQAMLAETVPEPVGKLYDLSIIEAVSGGDDEFVRKMVALFIDTVPGNVQELKGYMDGRNWDGVSKMAHKLKSTLDSMGIHSLQQAIRTVEMTAKHGETLENIPALVLKISTVLGACIKQLENEVLQLHA